VCTRDRPEKLDRLLQSLLRQTRQPRVVLVVDNAPSSDATEQLVRRLPDVRYVREAIPGLDFARNRALRESDSEIVAYVDDDAIVAEDWVESIAGVFAESPAIGVCTGRVVALTLATEGARLFEASGGFGRGDRRLHLPPGAAARPPGLPKPLAAWAFSVGAGVSLAVRRRFALDLGGFDEALDMGAVLPGGGDCDMLWRMLEAGHQVVYEPRVRAQHEHREDRRGAEQQILGHGRATVATLTKFVVVAPWRRKPPAAAFLAWRLAKPVVRLVRRLVGRDPLPADLLARLIVECWRGLFAYPQALRLAATRRREFGPADATTQTGPPARGLPEER
jgi:glycosyltransferase involved in cell wall biosynthesis